MGRKPWVHFWESRVVCPEKELSLHQYEGTEGDRLGLRGKEKADKTAWTRVSAGSTKGRGFEAKYLQLHRQTPWESPRSGSIKNWRTFFDGQNVPKNVKRLQILRDKNFGLKNQRHFDLSDHKICGHPHHASNQSRARNINRQRLRRQPQSNNTQNKWSYAGKASMQLKQFHSSSKNCIRSRLTIIYAWKIQAHKGKR